MICIHKVCRFVDSSQAARSHHRMFPPLQRGALGVYVNAGVMRSLLMQVCVSDSDLFPPIGAGCRGAPSASSFLLIPSFPRGVEQVNVTRRLPRERRKLYGWFWTLFITDGWRAESLLHRGLKRFSKRFCCILALITGHCHSPTRCLLFLESETVGLMSNMRKQVILFQAPHATHYQYCLVGKLTINFSFCAATLTVKNCRPSETHWFCWYWVAGVCSSV